jgi:hypothetical protein
VSCCAVPAFQDLLLPMAAPPDPTTCLTHLSMPSPTAPQTSTCSRRRPPPRRAAATASASPGTLRWRHSRRRSRRASWRVRTWLPTTTSSSRTRSSSTTSRST